MTIKHIFSLLVAIILPFVIMARCGSGGIGLHTKTVLAEKGIIIVEFSDDHQYIATNLNKRHPVYLQSGTTKIMLTVMEVLQGDYRLTQAILRADTTLSESETYLIHIDDIGNKAFPPKFLNEKSNNWTSGPIKVVRSNNKFANSYFITEARKTLVSYGCGPASWVYFNVSGVDSSNLYARTTVKNIKLNTVTNYILPIINGQIRVGHGMCTGAFYFATAGNYEITFTLLNMSFTQHQQSQTLVFSQPTTLTVEE